MNEEKQKLCSAKIYHDKWGFSSYNCKKKVVIDKGGVLYCKIHDPEYIKQKKDASDEKYNKECCLKCKYHFRFIDYKFCPLCGTKRKNG